MLKPDHVPDSDAPDSCSPLQTPQTCAMEETEHRFPTYQDTNRHPDKPPLRLNWTLYRDVGYGKALMRRAVVPIKISRLAALPDTGLYRTRLR